MRKKFESLRPLSDQHLPSRQNCRIYYDQAIGIVGAGAAGLSIAVILQKIGFTNVTILEASERIGGRIYTYEFQERTPCDHNYYDVGAMRIPDADTSAR